MPPTTNEQRKQQILALVDQCIQNQIDREKCKEEVNEIIDQLLLDPLPQ